MRYANIDKFETVNGEGVGISLFVQGCHFHCPGCFNSEAWDFSGGEEWTPEVEKDFLDLASRSYINRISILGGEPLADENIEAIVDLLTNIRDKFGFSKKIWLYTGYTFEEIRYKKLNLTSADLLRYGALWVFDVVVDGRFIEKQKDLTLKFRGSSNQRIIDARKTFINGGGEIILWQQ